MDQPVPEGTLTRLLWVRNVSAVHQGVGCAEFEPGEAKEIPATFALQLVKTPEFEFCDDAGDLPPVHREPHAHAGPRILPKPPPSGARNIPLVAQKDFIEEVRHSIRPDPDLEPWVDLQRAQVFPCQSDEWNPVEPADEPFSVCFRMRDLVELHGGARVILRLAGYLADRGHEVTLAIERTAIRTEHVEDLGVTVEADLVDADFVIGTFWTTIEEVAAFQGDGVKVAFLQSDEPSWLRSDDPSRKRCEASLRHPDVQYVAISKHVERGVSLNYGVRCIYTLPGNGVDSLDFSPRVNHQDRRLGVCSIFRGSWFKNDAYAVAVMGQLKAAVPGLTVRMAGFQRLSNPGLDEYLHCPSVEQMASMYSQSDFYVSGSRIEGSPLPPLEAMACGCIPAVTSPGTEEYLVDGVNGLVIDADRPADAVKRIVAVLEDDGLRRRMMNEALRTSRARPWRTLCEEFEYALSRCANA